MKQKLIVAFLLMCSISVNAQLQSPVKWSYVAKRTSATAAILYLKATMEDSWHIYSTAQKAGGPEKTSFNWEKSNDYSLVGKITEPKPVVKYEETFGMNVLYFDKEVVFTQKIALKAKQTTVKGKVIFMACNSTACLPPAEVNFSIPVK